MDIRCERCGTVYELDEARLSEEETKVRCSVCQHTFRLRRESVEPSPQPGNKEQYSILVRTKHNRVLPFQDTASLKRWIRRGRLGREDEISRDGTNWNPLGSIAPLAASFREHELGIPQTKDAATTQGNSANKRSELYSNKREERLVRPVQNEDDQEGWVTEKDPPLDINEVHVVSGPSQSPSHQRGLYSPALAEDDAIGFGDNLVAERHDALNPSFEIEPTTRRNARTRPPAPPPAAFPTGMSNLRMDVAFSGRDFRRARSRSSSNYGLGTILIVLGLILGGVGAGLILSQSYSGTEAWYPARLFGLISPQPSEESPDPQLRIFLNTANLLSDLDTPDGRVRALGELKAAQQLAPLNSRIRAERAFVLIQSALASNREANTLTEETERFDDLKASERTSDDPEAEKLLSEARKQRAAAQMYLKTAKKLLKASKDNHHDVSRSRRRALAAYALATKNSKKLQRLLKQRQKGDSEDAYLVQIRASAHLLSYDHTLNKADLARASKLLRTAIELRPSFNRARVQLAQNLLRSGAFNEAKIILAPVLEKAPQHPEANELMADIDAQNSTQEELQLQRTTRKLPPYELWMRAGFKRRSQGRVSASLSAFKKAAEINPIAPDPWVGVGWAYLHHRKYKDALTSFTQAALINPQFSEALLGLAETHMRLGAEAAALRAYRNFLDEAPDTSPDRARAKAKVKKLEQLLHIQTSSSPPGSTTVGHLAP